MAPEPEERDPSDDSEAGESINDENEGHGDEGEEEEDDEPRLKYARLTGNLGGVYRNGDATSTVTIAGDKMVCFISTIWELYTPETEVPR
jgi:hypothetical protein